MSSLTASQEAVLAAMLLVFLLSTPCCDAALLRRLVDLDTSEGHVEGGKCTNFLPHSDNQQLQGPEMHTPKARTRLCHMVREP